MNTHGIKFILAVIMSLCLEQAFAETTSGQQCKALLNPVVDQLFSYQNRANYYSINNEIPNVITTDLEVIAQKGSSNDVVKSFSQMAQNIIGKCNQTCHNLPLSNGGKLNCELMGKTNPKELRLGLALIEDGAKTEVTTQIAAESATATDSSEKPSAACSFEPERAECLIAAQETTVEAAQETTAEATQRVARSSQNTDNSNTDIYQTFADKMNQQQYRAEDKASQQAVW